MRKFTVSEAETGFRADVFVAKQYSEFSRASLEALFDGGFVSLDGKTIRASHKLKLEQKVEVDDAILHIKPPKIELPIIYEDDNVVVINKPEGLLTHSKGGFNNEATVATWLIDHLKKHSYSIKRLFPGCHPGNSRLGIAHRLDRATSGVMITAKNQDTLKALQKQFAQRRTKKTYLAIVEGVPEPAEAIIDAPIERNPRKPQTFRVNEVGRSAQTHYKILKILNESSIPESLLELKPATGRTHQLRVHLEYIGHPIIGDRMYGHEAEHMLLHASSLELTLPTGKRMVFKAEPPDYFPEYV